MASSGFGGFHTPSGILLKNFQLYKKQILSMILTILKQMEVGVHAFMGIYVYNNFYL